MNPVPYHRNRPEGNPEAVGEAVSVAGRGGFFLWHWARDTASLFVVTIPSQLPSMNIKQTELTPGYPILEITHPAVSARIALCGAHLMEWTPAGHDPVLYLSPEALYEEGKPIRGGVPLCWPWFGGHPDDPALPSHGLVRTCFWKQGPVTTDETGVTLKFTLTDDPESRRCWDHPFHLELDMRLGASLQLSLQMTNPGPSGVNLTSALHTYLTIGDIRQIRVTGLDGVPYLDTVGSRTVHQQSGDITFDREVDRLYATGGAVAVHDPVLQRIITVRSGGSGCSVVWNPWIAKAARLTDLPDEDYQRFVCVETANAWEDVITLAPGATHTLTTCLELQRTSRAK